MRRAFPLSSTLCALLAAAPAASAGAPGTLRYGAVPGGAGGRPVLLFIHGWNSDASTWSGGNDMEAKAAAGGYRTAFLDVHADGSMWTNAPLIATAVDAVKARHGSPVVLVCHSKGGVDAQTAVIYGGAGPKVERIITLGSPHWGTPLADLAWSTWTGWLAALLGSRNEGNRVLQTGYMAAFRAQADARPEARATPLFTAGGTKAGPFFSAYCWGGLAIGRTSDGVVPLDSAAWPTSGAASSPRPGTTTRCIWEARPGPTWPATWPSRSLGSPRRRSPVPRRQGKPPRRLAPPWTGSTAAAPRRRASPRPSSPWTKDNPRSPSCSRLRNHRGRPGP